MMYATPGQKIMLFSLWNQAKRVLMNGRETWTKHEEDRRRHELTKQILGREKSWGLLNRRSDVDLLKAGLLAIIRPGDLDTQLRMVRSDHKRLMYRLRQLQRELDVDSNYVQAIIDRMNADGKLGSSDLDLLGTEDLRKVVIALQQQKRRAGRTYILHTA